MSYPAPSMFPAAVKPDPLNPFRPPWAFDAALPAQGSAAYTASLPFMTALAQWRTLITDQRLFDENVSTLHNMSVDPRDGALCRGKGGAGYTPHAWSQLVSLMRASGAPTGLGNVTRWLAPLTRHHAWTDITRTSLRPRAEEGVMRMMWVRPNGPTSLAIPVMRAVVSGRHSLTHFDDLAVLLTVGNLEEKPQRARISRGWDETHATFDLDSGQSDVGLSFYMRNSETGCAALSFSAALRIAALDAAVVMPSGEKYERVVRLAASNEASTRRRHTLPRKAGEGRVSEENRSRIAKERIGVDITTALAGARVLAARWEVAKGEVFGGLVPLCKATEADDYAVRVLTDAMLEAGLADVVEVEGLVKRLAKVIADDARLRKLPHGSAAHFAAALAVVADDGTSTGARSWDDVVATQKLSGQVLMNGWPK